MQPWVQREESEARIRDEQCMSRHDEFMQFEGGEEFCELWASSGEPPINQCIPWLSSLDPPLLEDQYENAVDRLLKDKDLQNALTVLLVERRMVRLSRLVEGRV